MADEDKITRAWRLYQQGKLYNQRLTPNQYRLVETNTEFYIGNQWLRLPNTDAMRNLPKPTVNILKRVTQLFVASLTSTDIAMRFEPLFYHDGGPSPDTNKDAAAFANAEIANLLEKFHFQYRVRDALFDGAQTGDYCAHFWFDPDAEPYGGAFGGQKGEIRMELVDGINVMFGNPNSRDVEEQPYILIVGRDSVENLRREAEQFKKNRALYKGGKANPDAAKEIQRDSEVWDMPGVGGKVELEGGPDEEGKALYLLLYEKVWKYTEDTDADGNVIYDDVTDDSGLPVFEKDGGKPVLDIQGFPVVKRQARKSWKTTVRVTKATRTAVIYEDVDTGLAHYPVAWGNWEHQRNQYHGRALVTGLIPNQISINVMLATAIRHMQTMAFPKLAYNGDLISHWSSEVGQAIAVHGLQPGQAVSQVAYSIPVAEMSGQLLGVIDKIYDYTKDTMGATDAQLGQANAENTSALMLLQTNSEVPLENIRAGLYEWTESVGRILLDMMGTYYGTRPVVVDMEFTQPVIGPAGTPTIDPMTGMMATQTVTQKVTQPFDFSVLKRLWLNIRVDVGAAPRFSEVAVVQMLKELRQDGTLTALEYVERLPDSMLTEKNQLIEALKSRIAQGQQSNAGAGQAIPIPGTPVSAGGGMDEGLKVQGLPTMNEAGYEDLPNIAKKTALYQGALRAS